LAECRELRDAGEPPSRHFIRGLARLTRSQIGIRMSASRVSAGRVPFVESVQDFGWANDSDRDRVYQFVQSTPVDADPLSAAVLAHGDRVVTMTRADALSTGVWARSQVHNDVHLPSGIDDALLSLSRGERPGQVGVLAFKRARGERHYGAEERDLVHLAHAECQWALESPPGATEPPTEVDLNPREREIVDLLLSGASEKSIAATLGISPPTAHTYVQAIYRRFGVESRAELMSRALPASRQGRD
ncbi:MAG TPA: LuxR C-terminal-related transcriptional regulator, partial [Polyangiaceae bacterium]